MKRKDYGLLFAIISSFFSSIATVFAASAVKLLNPFALIAGINLLAGVFFIIVLKFYYKTDVLGVLRKNKKDIALTTFLRINIAQVILAFGLLYTEGIKAIFFTKIEPYFVLLWHWLYRREKIYRKQVLLLAIHLSGSFLLSTSGNIGILGKTQLGDLLVISAMAITAFAYGYATRLSKSIGSVASNGLTSLIGGTFTLPLLLIFPLPQFSAVGLSHLLLTAILLNIVGLTLWFEALKTVKGWIVSAVRAIGPIAGAGAAFVLFGQTLTQMQILGAIMVVATSFLITREHKE